MPLTEWAPERPGQHSGRFEFVGTGGQGDDMAVCRGNTGGGAEGGVVDHLLQKLLGYLKLVDAAIRVGHLAAAVQNVARRVHDDAGKQTELVILLGVSMYR